MLGSPLDYTVDARFTDCSGFAKFFITSGASYTGAMRLLKTSGAQPAEQEIETVAITRHFLSSSVRLSCTCSHSPRVLAMLS